MEQVTQKEYLELLAETYSTVQDVCTEIINLQAILNLPKGTEHFLSDLHGEYEAFYHILNNCSGVIKEKVEYIFSERLSKEERSELCTLIYYPKEKLERLKEANRTTEEWYAFTLNCLIELAKFLSSKYTRSKVRKAMPKEYSYILDELLHAQKDEENNQVVYHKKIIDTLISLKQGDAIISALAVLIKRLSVDHLHIVGDIFDRGSRADAILDLLMQQRNLDIQWGNHDILWMGAAAGNLACIARVVRNSVNYKNIEVLEKGYGISLRPLTLFAERIYPECKDPMRATFEAISIMMLKLEGQIVMRHPEYNMEDRLLFNQVDFEAKTITIDNKVYPLKDLEFPTINPESPYDLTDEEQEIIEELAVAFLEGERLQRHVKFLYEEGSMYKKFNGNLLFHGCIPLNEDGSLKQVTINGRAYYGKNYMDYADLVARRAYFEKQESDLDFMWYLWCGSDSPLSGRIIKTFESMLIEDKETWKEPRNPYFTYYLKEETCRMILREFGLYNENAHIINGHTPVEVIKGESPVRANGRLFVIDGGFCRNYHEKTGIAGYTLIYNSHGMRIKAHQKFESMEKVLDDNSDIKSNSRFIEEETKRMMVADTDTGRKIKQQITHLEKLLDAYQQGIIVQKHNKKI
ncbi:MAG: fructose-1,6-bisphosphatase [bacterium]|nr:fructose-1,6-bisphosphatase [bacterium]